MRLFIFSFAILPFIVLTFAAPSPHKDDHGKATSYSIFTKHESKHDNHESHSDQTDHHDPHGHKFEHHHGHHVEHHHEDKEDHDEHHSHPKYDFKYGVKDTKTGDIKEQWESRDGDKVEGGYSLKEADGTTRLVKYTSDKKTGFEATVHKIGHPTHDHKEHSHKEHIQHHGYPVHSLFLV